MAKQTARRLFADQQQVNEEVVLPAMTGESTSPNRRVGVPPLEDDEEGAHQSPDPDHGNGEDDEGVLRMHVDHHPPGSKVMALNEGADPSSQGVHGRPRQPICRLESSPPAIHMPDNVAAGLTVPHATAS